MTPARWRQVSRIYYDALARDSRERVSFLREACRDDEALRQEVESLLAQPASAAWARCTARATPNSVATLRSKSCRVSFRQMLNGWRASNARRGCSPR